MINYEGKGISPDYKITNAIENLEYGFSPALQK